MGKTLVLLLPAQLPPPHVTRDTSCGPPGCVIAVWQAAHTEDSWPPSMSMENDMQGRGWRMRDRVCALGCGAGALLCPSGG